MIKSKHFFTKAMSGISKNILRGIVRESKPRRINKALERIRIRGGDLDYRNAIATIRSNPLYERNGVTREFNKACPSGLSEVIRVPAIDIVQRINMEKDKVLNLLNVQISAQQSIQEAHYLVAIDQLRLLVRQEGISCCFLRILCFLTNRLADIPESKESLEIQDRLQALTANIAIENFSFLRNVMHELANSHTNYFNISKRISENTGTNPFDYIAKNQLKHITLAPVESNDLLSSYYSISLLDAFLYISISQRYSNVFSDAYSQIGTELKSAYSILAGIESNLQPFYCADEYSDISIGFFRESFLLIDQYEYYKYKTIHGALFNASEEKELERTAEEKKLIGEYFDHIESLSSLKSGSNYRINISKLDPNCCNFQERSSALLLYIEQNDGNIEDEEDCFVHLMSQTRDIGLVCPIQYLQKIRKNAKSQELKLVLSCLVSIKDESQLAEHDLRKILQEVCVESYHSSISELLEYVYVISPAVTEHLVEICDETFLSKLFHITDKPNKAIEDRADILEWYGRTVNEAVYIQRAKNLRIDVQISKQKGTIDDSRIYVDPIKFTQWISDNVEIDIGLLLAQVHYQGEISSVSINWGNVTTGVSPKDQIATFLILCYEEFCNNKIFGIASYLGRRIRHGTFKGTGLKEVKDFFTEPNYSAIFDEKEFREEYEAWVNSYEGMLEAIKSDNLHICSKKKPEGLIHNKFNSKTKKYLADRFYIDIHNHYVETDSTTGLPYMITEYCWRIIEEDMNNIGKFLMEKKSKHAVFRTERPRIMKLHTKCVHDFSQEVNSVTADKFRTISNWFSKPSIASPSADLVLIFNAAVFEVKGIYENFEPRIEAPTESFNINGGQYHAIYDALKILIENAADYGKKTGLLKFSIDNFPKMKHIQLSLTSETLSPKDMKKAKVRIERGLNVNFEDAHVMEGNSGIKKLNQLEEDGFISDVEYDFPAPYIVASFNFPMG